MTEIEVLEESQGAPEVLHEKFSPSNVITNSAMSGHFQNKELKSSSYCVSLGKVDWLTHGAALCNSCSVSSLLLTFSGAFLFNLSVYRYVTPSPPRV